MDKDLLQKIDERIDAVRSELAQTTIEMVNIKSVRGEELPGAPFGEGPRKVLDTMLEKGRDAGFYTVDYNVGVISLAMKDSEPDLGIWLHGDVVPEGDGWNFEPYNAVEYKGCIIGRGATDNKGQMASIYHLLRIFKDLNIDLKYNPALYVGSCEETGMEDVRGFIEKYQPPKLSLVPDSSFPAAYGGRGSVKAILRSKTPLEGFTLTAGQDASPGRAVAVFSTQEDFPGQLPECAVEKQADGSITVTADVLPMHGNSKGGGNAVVKICEALSTIETLCDNDQKLIAGLEQIAKDTDAECLNIAVEEDNVMGPLNMTCKRVDWKDGYLVPTVIITYPLGVEKEWIAEKLTAAADVLGFEVSSIPYTKNPYILDPECETAKMIHRVANEVTGDNKPLYIVRGGTYAHFLPNAYACGMDGSLPPEDFAKGRGGAHGLDEAVSLDRLQRAMKIYARILLELNEMDW